MRFEFVAFGERAPAGAAACDGLVPGARLDLTHWARNRTPAHLKRDTSTEIALAFAEERGSHDVEIAANNHFDTDGVLAVWALLRPELASAHRALIVSAAEVGDFDDWPEDERGAWLEAAIARVGAIGSDRQRYARVLPLLDALVPDLARREDLWGESVRAFHAAGAAIERGDVEIERHGRLAMFTHAPGVPELPGPWISRNARGADRWLLAFAEGDGFRYRYELPRWAWAETVKRPRVRTPRRGPLRGALGGDAWVIRGRAGMTGLLYTPTAIGTRPVDLARTLVACDGEGLDVSGGPEVSGAQRV